jgi:hypothetical protein
MTKKIANITLDWGFCPEGEPPGTHGYRVRSVTDSLEFHPGQILKKPQVEELCASGQWKVIVRAP